MREKELFYESKDHAFIFLSPYLQGLFWTLVIKHPKHLLNRCWMKKNLIKMILPEILTSYNTIKIR